VLKEEKEIAEKIAARAYTKQFFSDLLPTVFTSLRSHGYFYDPVEKGQHQLPLQHRFPYYCINQSSGGGSVTRDE